MSIRLPAGLPAAAILRREGVRVLETARSAPSRRSLRVGLVNLMPSKEATELALARLVAKSGRDAEIVLIVPADYLPRHVPPAHLSRFYRRWPDVAGERFDALIVTGAPVETLPFEEVAYWREMREILAWARAHVGTALYICWAAQAALHVFRGLPKQELAEKAFGVFEQNVIAHDSALMRGMGPGFAVPVSRHTEIPESLLARPGLEVLARSAETGACVVEDAENRAVCIFDHLEYDGDTLRREFERDVAAGKRISPPRHTSEGRRWQEHAALFFRNWLDLAAARRAGAGLRRVADQIPDRRRIEAVAGMVDPRAALHHAEDVHPVPRIDMAAGRRHAAGHRELA